MWRLVASLVVIAGLAAWSGAHAGQRVNSVVVSPDTLTLNVGEVGIMTATVRNEYGTALTWDSRWTVRDTTVVRPIVPATGATARPVARAAGTTWVYVQAWRRADSAQIVVSP